MANLTNKSTNTWTPNATQKHFMELVGSYENGVTMFELKLAGHDFKTGSVNTLLTKGLVVTDADERVFECDVVYNGVKVGTTKKTGKVYRLAQTVHILATTGCAYTDWGMGTLAPHGDQCSRDSTRTHTNQEAETLCGKMMVQLQQG